MGDGGIVHLGCLAVYIVLQALHGLGVLLCPSIDVALALGNDFALLISALGIKCFYLVKDYPGILGIAAQVLNGLAVVGARLAQRVAVSAALALKVLALGCHSAAAHDGAADDDGGTLFLGECFVQCVGQSGGVGTVTLDDVPIPRTVLHGGIFVAHGVTVGRELHSVAVVEHDQVVQPQISGNAGGLL